MSNYVGVTAKHIELIGPDRIERDAFSGEC
jgi:hypothetical protein